MTSTLVIDGTSIEIPNTPHLFVTEDSQFTVDQVQAVTLAAAARGTGARHQPMELWQFADDCGHTDPENDPKYFGVDEAIDAAAAGLPKPEHWTLEGAAAYQRARDEIAKTVPIAQEFEAARLAYAHEHEGNLCKANPLGTTCVGCDYGDDDSGWEPGPCCRTEAARDKNADFWWLFNAERGPRLDEWGNALTEAA